MSTMDTKTKELMEALMHSVNNLAGPGACVIIDAGMPREQQEMELYAGFLREGLPPDVAKRKAGEFLELAETARAQETLPN